ncbi:LPS export ABC transporter permease LptG [Hahella sp. SMD15-11]|uniref:LPS export ABC transporter permease LptG n=1 Tax=Thermohahella caldifontis TaxID=3142973 RepID=A0AB39UYC2_9GAMM
MRRLDRYIVSTVAGAMFLVLVVVLALDLVFALIGEMEDIKGEYQILQALMYISYTIPRRIYDYLPLAAFIGALAGLGVLANTSELTVMRAAGVSIRRIAWSTLKPALVIILAGMLLGEYVAPFTERVAKTYKSLARGEAETISSSTGLWHREGNTFMHFNAVQPKGVLLGVQLFEFDETGRLQKAVEARRALFQGDHWLLYDVRETQLGAQQTTVSRHATRPWQSELAPDVLGVLVLDPDYLSIRGLSTYIGYLSEQGLNADRYQLSFWNKVLRPLATAVLVLVAISFIFGPLRSVTMGFRVFCGILVGLVFKYMQDMLGPASVVYGFHPALAVALPILISAIAATLLFRRIR